MNLNDGKEHIVKFSKGSLYIDGNKVAGVGIVPEKEIVFKFRTNIIQEVPKVGAIRDAEIIKEEKFEPILSVNVKDTIASKDIGPGQPK